MQSSLSVIFENRIAIYNLLHGLFSYEGDALMKNEDRIDSEHMNGNNLIDFIIIFFKHKRMILAVFLMTVVGLATLYFLLTKEKIEETSIPKPARYESECIIVKSVDASLDQIETLLKSRYLATQVIESNNLLPYLYPEIWDKTSKKWKAGTPPSLNDTYTRINDNLKLKSEKNILKISFSSTDKELPQKMIGYYLAGLSEHLRESNRANIENMLNDIKQQLVQTKDPLRKTILKDMMAEQINLEVKLKTAPFYGFSVIEPPSPAFMGGDIPAAAKLKAQLTRSSAIFLIILVSFLFATFCAYLSEYINKLKQTKPEKVQLLKKYIKFKS